jgi:F-box-like
MGPTSTRTTINFHQFDIMPSTLSPHHMALNELPDELMAWVFSYLESHNDLSNVALCSKRFYNLVIPFLYASFTDDGALPRTSGFLSTVIRRPDLAQYVKTFGLTISGFDAFPSDPFQIDFDGTWRKFEALMKERLCGDDILVLDWYNDFRFSANAITALATTVLPNISTLNLPYDYLHRMLIQTSQPQNSSTPSPHSLDKIRSLGIGRSFLGSTLWDMLQPFLELKHLQRFSCTDIWVPNSNARFIKKLTSHITHLTLNLGSIGPAALVQLLKSCPDLAHFTYIYSNLDDDDEEDENGRFIPGKMREGLLHLEDSLQELVLLNLDEKCGKFKVEDLLLPLGPLAGFRKLHRLQATARTLVGHEDAWNGSVPAYGEALYKQSVEGQALRFAAGLPDSLEELVMENSTDTIYAVMAVLFDSKRTGKLQKLSVVRLVLDKGLKADSEGAVCCIEEGKIVGVVVKVEPATFEVLLDSPR